MLGIELLRTILGNISHRPALAYFKDNLYLAWTGTGSPKLNVMSYGGGTQWTNQQTPGDQCNAGPALVASEHLLRGRQERRGKRGKGEKGETLSSPSSPLPLLPFPPSRGCRIISASGILADEKLHPRDPIKLDQTRVRRSALPPFFTRSMLWSNRRCLKVRSPLL